MKRAMFPIVVIFLIQNVLSSAQDLEPLLVNTSLQVPQAQQNEVPEISVLAGGSERDQSTELKLKLSAADMGPFDQHEFGDILSMFHERYGVEFIIDHSAEDDELQAGTLITHDQLTLTAGELLESIAGGSNATYIVRNGTVVFISKDVANDLEYFSRRIFDVRTLLERLRAERPAIVERYPRLPQSSQEVPGTSGGMFQIISEDTTPRPAGAAGMEAPEKTEQILVVRPLWPEEQLRNLLLKTITPNDWSDTQGEATLSIIAGRLIVTHQRKALIEIEQFLDDLERSLEESVVR